MNRYKIFVSIKNSDIDPMSFFTWLKNCHRKGNTRVFNSLKEDLHRHIQNHRYDEFALFNYKKYKDELGL